MLISVANPFLENIIFFSLLLVALLIPTKPAQGDSSPLPLSLSLEMKGLAILTVIFGHIGYFLSQNHDFLFPLSTISGVGVDIFLLLSGYGLTISALSRTRSIPNFFTRNALKLYVPLSITLAILFVADFFLLGRSYGFTYILRSFAGFFPNADLFSDVNSPLWYFTFIVLFYTIFRLTFSKRFPLASAVAVTGLSLAVIWLTKPYFSGSVLHLYSLHFLAFPLGILLAWALTTFGKPSQFIATLKATHPIIRTGVMSLLLLVVAYLSMHTNISGFEQLVSLIIVAIFLCFFFIKKHRSRFLTLLGTYSFEIYLIHWPIFYRYDIFYKILPAGIATALYLCLFILLGYLFSKFISLVMSRSDHL